MMTFLAAVALATATPAATAPPQTIYTIRSSRVCTALRENVRTAIAGLLTNDQLTTGATGLMKTLQIDAADQPRNDGATGGAGSGSSIDDLQMNLLAGRVNDNLVKIDALLSDPKMFPVSPRTESERALIEVRTRLKAVAAQQRAELNIIAGTALSNMANDLNSRVDPMGGTSGNRGVPIRLAAPRQLADAAAQTKMSEASAAEVTIPLAASCH